MTLHGDFSLPPENVQSYPRPPLLEPVDYILRVELGEHVVAETRRGLRMLETHHAPTYYFPCGDVAAELRPVSGRTFCEWKGVAQYADVAIAGQVAPRASWFYNKPSSRFARLTDHIAFYPALMSVCYVGSLRVVPQLGNFYGGWVTPNLTGTIKGAPGTRHW